MSRASVPLFVYGSLRQGQHNCQPFLSRSRFISEGYTTDKKFVLTGYHSVPFAFIDNDDGLPLLGEVWDCHLDDYLAIRNLEIGAGYQNDAVQVQKIGHDRAPIACVMFSYPEIAEGMQGMESVVLSAYNEIRMISWSRNHN